ncbi:DUF2917 domain-containing protein [Mitsuaria sp. WAJ17]|uniref:DUF2917 domain-containing protein n=1 Tax=Mitsuaria sp. WAJ17 TaxID=2761452 RepID=UPI001602B65C|nr:DUF2917 domain-containing protein [Mitsuaria sp. WAJ17]MBB2483799.1 DUF2917 domain-containing protein [Mitsuaria sp. WAJ17]
MDTTLPSPTALPSTSPTAAPRPGSQLLVLDASGHSQALDCPSGGELRILQGRVWISREGHAEDLFLDSGELLRLKDAARLHLSAERAAPAWVRVSPE